MQRLEVSGAVRPIYGSLGVRRLRSSHRDAGTYRLNHTPRGTGSVLRRLEPWNAQPWEYQTWQRNLFHGFIFL